MSDDTPKLILSLDNMHSVQMQLEDEKSVLAELLSDGGEEDLELQSAHDATVELQSELQPLLARVETNKLFVH